MRVILALEWSSPVLSVAVLAGEELSQAELQLKRFRMPDALGLIDQVLKKAGVTAGDLTEVRTGRGPGNFTGVRQSLAVAGGLSAPGGVSVVSACSGVILSAGLPESESPMWMLGDARRGLWWGARLPVATSPEWMLLSPQEWRTRIGDEAVVSPEPERLDGLHAGFRVPHARELIALSPDQLQEPLTPMYLQQAV